MKKTVALIVITLVAFVSTSRSNDNKEIKHVGFENIRIVGIRLITFSNSNEYNMRPFNYPVGYTLAILGKLTEPITNVEQVVITEARTSNGKSILPDKHDKPLVQPFPSLSMDKKNVMFEAEFKIPDNEVYLKKVAGYVDCEIAKDSQDVDLEFVEIKTGATGKHLEAVINKIGKDKTFGFFSGDIFIEENVIDFSIKCSKDLIKAVKIFDKNNKLVNTEQRSVTFMPNRTTYKLAIKSPISTDGKIVLEIYKNIKK